MKAVLSKETGGPETLVVEDIDAPTPAKGEVLVKVAACAINFPDTLIIRDMYQFKPPRPFAPGGEISGTIEALGEGVEGFAVGDRVMCGIGNGGLQEKVAVAAERLFKVPEGIDLVKASALLMTYGTTIHGLKDRGDIKEGETVLVLGAAGGVGLSAVELAKAYGCRVVALVAGKRGEDRLHRAELRSARAGAEQQGADEAVLVPEADHVADSVRRAAPVPPRPRRDAPRSGAGCCYRGASATHSSFRRHAARRGFLSGAGHDGPGGAERRQKGLEALDSSKGLGYQVHECVRALSGRIAPHP